MADAICWIFTGLSIVVVGIIVFVRWRRNRLRIWLSNHPAECFFESLKWLKDREKEEVYGCKPDIFERKEKI